ncbi:WbqC family protein [Haloactinopolyspora sp.]|uniref:WbqC family protein n=1 Tax=Haloactinopolyspora sp. TaxID=1966353 RepID=UPI00262DA464|nr:WbqC family protein [Haloactinopolyspora sp.]
MAETIVSIHQPNFMPWVKLLDKILASDVYIAYDSVAYTKSEYHSRQKVRIDEGTAWVSVPLMHLRGTQQLIKDIKIENRQPFRYQHLRRLQISYGSWPYFDEVYPILEEVYGRDQEQLVDLNLDLIEAICTYLDSPVRIVRASSLPHAGGKTERLIQLVAGVGGDVHLTSTYGTTQHDVDWPSFAAAGIALSSQSFEHPEYQQGSRTGFVAHLAAVDMLFACGRKTRQILESRRRLIPIIPGKTETEG